ncbi:MerR HTH family regulatory protein [Nonomuraea maritima]|uniref:MerR HTH family regulatory protein n=1 Tax=Nonomuraea maritima TaxID=683260 RepID=A0A1G9M4H8_9ACTN|nr:MerR family transcriptional regulator [Nonomuraea maritima]SDL69202.1 MerR HTH family regulatory protein [Nonomuraea maritima]
MSDTWTLGELAGHAARALRADASPPANGRVRDLPGERLIRWYTTIGLIDPPLARRGRVAQYGRRHLLQLVAVKRLQAAGRSIAEIQAALAGATDRMLEATARLPAAGEPARPADDPPAEPRARFWAERPRTPDQDAVVLHDGPAPGEMVTGVRLAERVRIVLDATRLPSEEDVQAVLAAARPLLAVLEERELI